MQPAAKDAAGYQGDAAHSPAMVINRTMPSMASIGGMVQIMRRLEPPAAVTAQPTSSLRLIASAFLRKGGASRRAGRPGVPYLFSKTLPDGFLREAAAR